VDVVAVLAAEQPAVSGGAEQVDVLACWRPDCLTIASWCPAVLFDDPFAAAAVEGQDFAVPCCM